MNKFILLGEKIIVGTGKKILLIFLALCFSMCKTPLVNFDDSEETNFNPKNSVLKEFEATESKYSLFIFTSGFEGEEVSITNCNNVIYEGPLKTYEIQPFAKIVRVVNLCDTKFEDINNRISFNIKSEYLIKYKFVCIHRDYYKNKRYVITYSNKMKRIL